ncbi:hypothetical protein HAX54_014346 [Datura stramonium]|uniref:Uncharacterized protein n=1 Tax=Datura stramonium TaxID=4076 RepID=A0ABS8RYT6_DATST|nr:hypothetical protein [Datura stramonium]
MVKKFVEHKFASSELLKQQQKKSDLKLGIPADFIAEDLKKTAKRGSGLSALHKKLFKAGCYLRAGQGQVPVTLSMLCHCGGTGTIEWGQFSSHRWRVGGKSE